MQQGDVVLDGARKNARMSGEMIICGMKMSEGPRCFGDMLLSKSKRHEGKT